MGYRYNDVTQRYTKLIHRHQCFSFEMDQEAQEDEKDEDEENEAAPTASNAGPSSRVTPDMLASLQSTLIEGFASVTRRFDDVLAIQATFGTQLQALSDKVDDNHRQTQDYLDSLRD